MNITPEEQEQLDWCCSILTDEQIYECQLEAGEIAGVELHQDAAAELLVTLFARTPPTFGKGPHHRNS